MASHLNLLLERCVHARGLPSMISCIFLLGHRSDPHLFVVIVDMLSQYCVVCEQIQIWQNLRHRCHWKLVITVSPIWIIFRHILWSILCTIHLHRIHILVRHRIYLTLFIIDIKVKLFDFLKLLLIYHFHFLLHLLLICLFKELFLVLFIFIHLLKHI
jgi:hypothetical protein